MSDVYDRIGLAAAAVTESQLRGAYEMGIAHGRSGQRIGDPRQGDITHWSGCDSIHPECRRPDPCAILQDLIAQLREHCREPSCGCDIGRAADYAETRLRRLRDD